jgi:hypothetical protein
MDERHINVAPETALPSTEGRPNFQGSAGSEGSKRDIGPKSRAKSHIKAEFSKGFRAGSGESPAAENASASWLPTGFRLRGDGAILYEAEPDDWQWLCSPLSVEAATRNCEGEAWGRLIRVRDRDQGTNGRCRWLNLPALVTATARVFWTWG